MMNTELQVKREILLNKFDLFARYFFKALYGVKFRYNWHHHYFFDILEKVVSGELKRVIINTCPGSNKTEVFVILFTAYTFALNPKSKVFHLSYSQTLVGKNSRAIRRIINSPEFQELFDCHITKDSNSVGLWQTTKNGEFRAVSTMSEVTGFRAGVIGDEYAGALIIDDPLKNTDKFSKPRLEKANDAAKLAITSRLAHSNVPVIVVMQRLAEDDTTDYITSKFEGFTQFNFPALLTQDYVESLPEKYQNMIEMHGDEMSYCEEYKSTRELLVMRELDSYTFNAEYQQNPQSLNDALIKIDRCGVYNELPTLEYRFITVDVAQKTGERNDYTVFSHWGIANNQLYLINITRGKWEALDRERVAIQVCGQAKDMKNGALRFIAIEAKVSGIDLFQKLKNTGLPVQEYEKNQDKFSSVMDVLTYIELGNVLLPVEAEWLSDFILECKQFNRNMTHKHDDQVDTLVMAIKLGLVGETSLYDYYLRKANGFY